MTRRDWLHTMMFATAAWQAGDRDPLRAEAASQKPNERNSPSPRPNRAARDAVDHLLLGAPDLDAGIAWFEARTGVKPVAGGTHPGRGTRNALASFGARQYLEIIAPDPAQKEFNFQIDLRKLPGPRLVTWAASSTDVSADAAAATKAGYKVSGPQNGSRARPDGTVLRWRSLGVLGGFAAAEFDPVPFFIQWANDARHPSEDSPSGCRLTGLEFTHPQAAKLRDALAALGIDANVTTSPAAVLRATLQTPKGTVAL